jgi:hypothetical protein
MSKRTQTSLELTIVATMQPYVVFLLLAGLLGAQASINSNAYGGSDYTRNLHKLAMESSMCFSCMPAASPPKPSWAGSVRLDQAMQTSKAKPLSFNHVSCTQILRRCRRTSISRTICCSTLPSPCHKSRVPAEWTSPKTW